MKRLLLAVTTVFALSLAPWAALADHHESSDNPCADNPCGDNPCGDNPCGEGENPCGD